MRGLRRLLLAISASDGRSGRKGRMRVFKRPLRASQRPLQGASHAPTWREGWPQPLPARRSAGSGSQPGCRKPAGFSMPGRPRLKGRYVHFRRLTCEFFDSARTYQHNQRTTSRALKAHRAHGGYAQSPVRPLGCHFTKTAGKRLVLSPF